MTRIDPTPMMRIAIPLALALVLLPHAAAKETQMTVYLHENPLHALPEQINANVGDTLVLTIENPVADGKGPHNFLVCGDGAKMAEACDDRWGFTGMIQPGESAQVTVEVKEAGTFDYYCYIPGHKGAGMSGQLIVQGAAVEEEKGMPFGPVAVLALAGLALAWRKRA